MIDIKARAMSLGGTPIVGHYCKYQFVKASSGLTEEEKESGTPVPVSGEGEPTDYVVMRDAIQTTGTQQIEFDGTEFTATVAVFTEVRKDTVKRSTGFVDKHGSDIYEGDRIRYQCGVTSYEEYTVVFDGCKFCVSPQWEWGCNFSPFESRKVEVIA